MNPLLLLVDDNEEILEFLEHELNEKYTILKAVDGQQALDLLKENAVHLVISDVMMPVIDGFELCRLIKSNFEFSHIPVILLTARNTLQSKIEGLELGADAYIEKPFSPKHLLAQIDNLLTNRNKLKDFFASSPLTHIKSIAYSKADEEFLEKITDIISNNLKNPDLDVEFLARDMFMSRATLYRKISEICNLSPNELIKVNRLKQAAKLLTEGKFKLYEISDMVGFTSQHHFGRCFFKQFNMTPSEFQAKSHN